MSSTKQGAALDEAALKKLVGPERYAEVLAHLLHFRDADPAEVARRLGLAPELWQAADSFWSEELALGTRRQQRELALRFSTALGHSRSRLARAQPALASIGALQPAAAAAAPDAPETTPTPAHALPSFMAAPAPNVSAFTAAPATPPAAVAPALVAPPPAAPPLAPVAAPPLAPAAAPPSLKRPATMAVAIAVTPPEGLPLPFSEAVASSVALERAIEHAEAAQGAKPAKLPQLGSTSPTEADQIAAIARRVLPFAGSESSPSPASPAPAASAPAQATDPTPELPLERHASVHVELTLHPDKRAEILHRYGLSTAQHARADAQWQARLAKDANLRAAWDTACAQYRVWLLRTSAAG